MLTIRLQRVGRKNDPSFRVVLTDKRNAAQSGKFLEIVGSYNARHGEPQLKAQRIQHWLSKGAQASDTVHNLLVGAKIVTGPKRDVAPKAQKLAEVAEAPAPGAQTGQSIEGFAKDTVAAEHPPAEPTEKAENTGE